MAEPKAHEPELTEGEAVSRFEQAVKDHPDATSHFNLASAYYAAHFLDAAFTEFQEAVRLDPRLDHAHYYLGVIYKVRGDTDKARQEFEKVLNGGGHAMLKNQANIQLADLKNK